jgi:hypothetical protein
MRLKLDYCILRIATAFAVLASCHSVNEHKSLKVNFEFAPEKPPVTEGVGITDSQPDINLIRKMSAEAPHGQPVLEIEALGSDKRIVQSAILVAPYKAAVSKDLNNHESIKNIIWLKTDIHVPLDKGIFFLQIREGHRVIYLRSLIEIFATDLKDSIKMGIDFGAPALKDIAELPTNDEKTSRLFLKRAASTLVSCPKSPDLGAISCSNLTANVNAMLEI